MCISRLSDKLREQIIQIIWLIRLYRIIFETQFDRDITAFCAALLRKILAENEQLVCALIHKYIWFEHQITIISINFVRSRILIEEPYVE